MSNHVTGEAARLYDTWSRALTARENHRTDATDHAEDHAYETLVEYVEANDLNYSEFDPRGPSDE